MTRMCFEPARFAGDGSKTDEGRTREMKVWEAGEQGTESGRFLHDLPVPRPIYTVRRVIRYVECLTM